MIQLQATCYKYVLSILGNNVEIYVKDIVRFYLVDKGFILLVKKQWKNQLRNYISGMGQALQVPWAGFSSLHDCCYAPIASIGAT